MLLLPGLKLLLPKVQNIVGIEDGLRPLSTNTWQSLQEISQLDILDDQKVGPLFSNQVCQRLNRPWPAEVLQPEAIGVLVLEIMVSTCFAPLVHDCRCVPAQFAWPGTGWLFG